MVLKCLPTGVFESNCYILGNNGGGVVIDAGVSPEEVDGAVSEEGLKIKYIILTHGHIDHIAYVDEIRDRLKAKVLIHREDAEALTDPRQNLSSLMGSSSSFREADGLLKDGDVLEVGGMELEIIHTPGHTPGGICIKADKLIFSGDTLFKDSIGRTDLGNGNFEVLVHSIKSRLMVLDDTVAVYPGHGDFSTIGHEKRNNPFI
ncbi:MAG: MBL fold metallo-hydrolase [Clostridiales bacterium]|jgi:glyoxylase-like metal-dependent hydrolase (beta-lactamase superfamily II)|nr:MBL fold metallo-hydrolase [Eubacteriales bacterium]MDH7565510.1 MBL fold metallo-hydrolase [Clostridiales bacterium]